VKRLDLKVGDKRVVILYRTAGWRSTSNDGENADADFSSCSLFYSTEEV